MAPRRLILTLALVHLATALALLGVALYDTLVTYPAWFASIPASLEAAHRSGSGAVAARWGTWLGGGVVASALALAAAGWRQALARNLVLASAAIVLLVGAVTAVYFEPLVTILIRQGARMYTNDVLRVEARQFQQINWIRLANVVGAALGLSVPGVLRYVRGDQER